ncbi:kinesin-like protein KIF15 isoform X2 [Littorina saxatilis]|uniref:Kinesin motor domain-containing protein n=1 Tax=Littorina saxatilis TaxID=31220 RepID=A0AAN9GPT9_9CAEN
MKDNKAESSGEDAIKVIVRVRPPGNASSALPFAGQVVEVNSNNNSVTLLAKPDPKIFTFDHVADTDSSQESVFTSVGKALIDSCIAGYNGTIFAYGQTGSGKTFTMLGQSEECDNFQHELRGVIPRSFEHLFNLISREHELHGERKQFLCKCTFLEIYQEQVYDLLDPAAANLQIRENMKTGVFVDGLMEQVVATPAEAYQALSTGWLNRRVAATSMNRESSRSHAVFTLCIESKEEKNGVKNVRQSLLNLVDLAGSERQKDTNALGIRLKEAGKINQSLSVLGNVIMSLVKISQGRPQHIPYRDSKLTFLLRDSLGGNARTSIVACVHPDAKCFGETLSTLNFAKRAKLIKNKAVVNEDTQGNVAHLQTEIRRLRDMLTQLQSSSVPHPIPLDAASGEGNSGPLPPQGTDAGEWRRRFLEAMLFMGKAEQEKEVLRQQLCSYEEEMKKKDRCVQSSRLIIKFRESTISKLEKAARNTGNEPDTDPANAKIQEDIEGLKSQLEQYPQISQLDHQLHSLRAQLADARIRLSSTQATLLDSNRLTELEKAFQELQSAKRRESIIGSPRPGDVQSSAAMQKLHEKVKTMEEETQKLKKQAVEEEHTWREKEAALQAELTASKKMTSDLERLLEANSLKQRMQQDALSNLHYQTIRGLTPTRETYDLRTRTVLVCKKDQDQSMETEGAEDICEEAPPAAMMENAHEILTDEIKALQQTNGSLQERLEEYETDMLRLQQQVNQFELEKESLSEMLNKERKDSAEKLEEQEKSQRKLTTALNSLTTELTYANEEVRDYQLLLQSSDKELKVEKDKIKTNSSSTDHKINSLETQLLQVQSLVETLGKQLEEEAKEREMMEEKLELERTEKMFQEQQLLTMEKAFKEQNRQLLTSQAKVQEEQQVQLQQLETVTAELEVAKRSASDNQVALQQQVQRVQELRAQLQAAEDKCSLLQDLVDCRSSEVADAKQRLEALEAEMVAKNTEITTAAMQKELLNEDLAFYQEQSEKNVEECDSLRHSIETLEKEKQVLHREVDSLKVEIQERDGRLQAIKQHLEELKNQQCGTPTVSSPEKVVECNSVNDKLAAMVEELTQGREQWMTENQQLKREVTTLKQEVIRMVSLTHRCEELQTQLDNQAAVFKESINQMHEDTAAQRSETHMLRESLVEAQRQQETARQEIQLLLSQFEEAQQERKHAEEELNRLKSVVEKSYAEKDVLRSLMEELREEFMKTKEELTVASERAKELADFNAVLAGHANHQQKVSYVRKIQTDYNSMKEKFEEMAKENFSLRAGLTSSPLRDRTNVPTSTPQKDAENVKVLPL